jgi:molecular chaperone GrpE
MFKKNIKKVSAKKHNEETLNNASNKKVDNHIFTETNKNISENNIKDITNMENQTLNEQTNDVITNDETQNEQQNGNFENQQESNKTKELMEEIKNLKEQNEVLKKERDDYKDAFLRKAADLENFRRAKEKEFSEFAKYSSEKILLKFLEIYDDMEKAIQYIDSPKHFNALKDGVVMVFNKFTKLLESEEVKKIEAEGEEFNVDLHDALMQQPTDKMPPNKVLKVIENGYTYKDKILKHAKVIVSTEPNQ